jgi:hypothetical protein
MITEYVGIAQRWAGAGVVHEVRAFWHAVTDSDGAVKAAALRALREGGVTDHAEFTGRDLDTYSSPQLAAVYRFRVLTDAEFGHRAELRSRVYRTCSKCGDSAPGQLVRMHEGQTECALCFGCWHPVKSACKVLHWIGRNGKLQV